MRHRLGKFENLVNRNHRHDEKHEQETDAKRTEIAEGHRFQSFAPARDGNKIKWYVDGRDYFHAVSVALERAKETIYIADWWLSPELFLRRPPYSNQKWRLDYTLKRAAERGVKIYVNVYREVSHALTCNSEHTKKALTALCPEGTKGYGNIRIMRHPDHNVFENASDMTFYWAHHEKFIVIDYDLAFIGGLDLCFGRWDSRQHPLADVHPSDVQDEVFPGQDFNNNRIMDFQNVNDWKNNELSKADYGRMPWHDVAMGVIGPSVYDIAEHFVLRWNFCKRDKYKRDDRFDWLTLEGKLGEEEDLVGVQRPKHPVGDYIQHPFSPLAGKLGNPNQEITRPETKPQAKTRPVGTRLDSEGQLFFDSHRTLDEHGYTSEQHQLGHGMQKRFKDSIHSMHSSHLHTDKPLPEIPGEPHPSEAHHHEANPSTPTKQQNPKATGRDPPKEGIITASGGVQEKQKGYLSTQVDHGQRLGQGTVHAQLVRSSADWSLGILTEQSIQNAYCQVIRDARHFVYIENQFFITATGENQAPVHNLIGAAIVDACIAAAKEGRKFRVILVIPCIPGFAGDLRSNAAAGTRAIMDYQYKSICRGEESIYGKIRAAGFDPTEYIFVFNLRSYDRVNTTTALREQEKQSGVKYQEVQRAHAEEIMPEGLHTTESLDVRSKEKISNSKDKASSTKSDFMDKMRSLRMGGKDKDDGKHDVEQEEGPENDADLAEKKRQFESVKNLDTAGEGQDGVVQSVDSIAKAAMLGEKKPSEETWEGRTEDGQPKGTDEHSEELRQRETDNFVQEELYIHAKVSCSERLRYTKYFLGSTNSFIHSFVSLMIVWSSVAPATSTTAVNSVSTTRNSVSSWKTHIHSSRRWTAMSTPLAITPPLYGDCCGGSIWVFYTRSHSMHPKIPTLNRRVTGRTTGVPATNGTNSWKTRCPMICGKCGQNRRPRTP